MKEFLQDRLNIILCITFVLILTFLLDVKFGPWYGKQLHENEFNTESFYDDLKVISWTILQWPSNELYNEYGEFLDSTDEYLKLETYDFTNSPVTGLFFMIWKYWIP